MITLPLLFVLAATNQAAPQPSCFELRSRADAAYLEGRLAEAAGAYRQFLAQCPCSSTPPASVGAGLVGPGPGVIEPKLLKIGPLPSTSHPTVLLALVNGSGRVAETHVLKSSGDTATDTAILAALKAAEFEPATKDGTPVQMWKALSIPSASK